ncbi:helix-turn-helix domain-containing protein (plasmid) [Lactobacillus curvatus]|nr:helix-turn-helix domain-containing protein [Latilactobacillus curvatus]MSD84747.1 helix-turn-helix domain-containing protein [Latilactobacillus curvatus]MSE23483.1 helix-turn-helix domain-containing protein [Latilactobacillus curvatus]MSE24947.1 helix-turn-helix domain-containing protein [Latilactobacillus curvatus]
MQTKLLGLRKSFNLSQEDMAKLIGVTTTTYARKERGEYAFDADEMFIISKYFEEDMVNIFLPRSYRNGNKRTQLA